MYSASWVLEMGQIYLREDWEVEALEQKLEGNSYLHALSFIVINRIGKFKINVKG